jgi:ligand-binding SRPBCC domain-containing protein
MQHILRASMFVPRPRAEVFAFFADARNLERITPPELKFRIVTREPIIKKDALIDYRLGLFGLSFNWRTLIAEWNAPHRFVDVQLKGPYRSWHHTHSFFDERHGTRIEDEVRYELPLPPLGDVAYPIVRLQLRRIFNYRQKIIGQLLMEENEY